MKIFIAAIIPSMLSMSLAFAQPSNLSHDAHRFIDNAIAFSHVEAARYERPHIKINKASVISFSEMNEHERAIIAHSFMDNSTPYAHQKIIERHKKKLNKSETNTASSSFSELNAGDRVALVREHANNVGAEAHQIQARDLRGSYESKKQSTECVRLSYDPSTSREGHRTGR